MLKPWWQPILLLGAVCLVYYNSVTTPFLFDDAGAIVNNASIHRLASWNIFLPPHDGSTTTGRPVVNFTFALNYALSGLDVWSYHVVNILIHALNALLLLGILRRTFSTLAFKSDRTAMGGLLAFAISVLWAVHPLNSESVVCIAQRTESLCALFYLLTLYAFCRATGDDSQSRWWLALSVLSCFVGMATKEVMVTAPVVIFLYDRTFISGSFSAAWRRHWVYLALLASTWGLLLLLLFQSGGARGDSAGFGLGLSAWHYLLRQAHAIVLYFKLAFWPHPLVLDYGDAVETSLRDVWSQAAVVVGLLGFTVWALVRKPRIGFVCAWVFIILAPSSSIVPLVTQSMAEHRMYLPLMSILAGTAFVFNRWFISINRWPIAVGLSLILGTLTWVRNRDYQDALTIWRDTVEKFPSSARGHNNFALELERAGRTQEADREFSEAIALQPNYISAHANWGSALLTQGRLDEALAQLLIAVQRGPTYTDARLHLGNALAAAGRTQEAISQYEEALRLQPTAPDIHFNLGVALDKAGLRGEAAQHLKIALEARPELVEAHYRLARIADESGDMKGAEEEYDEVLRRDPLHAAAEAGLGVLLARAGEAERAVSHLKNAARLRPNDPDTLSNLGNVYLLQGRTREAIDNYEASLRLRSDDADTRENLRIARAALN